MSSWTFHEFPFLGTSPATYPVAPGHATSSLTRHRGRAERPRQPLKVLSELLLLSRRERLGLHSRVAEVQSRPEKPAGHVIGQRREQVIHPRRPLRRFVRQDHVQTADELRLKHPK